MNIHETNSVYHFCYLWTLKESQNLLTFFWRNIFKHFIFWHFIGFGTGDVNTEKTFENFGTFFLQCDISIIFCEFYIWTWLFQGPRHVARNSEKLSAQKIYLSESYKSNIFVNYYVSAITEFFSCDLDTNWLLQRRSKLR